MFCICFSVNVTVRTEPLNATLIGSTYIDLVCDIDSSSGGNISFTWTGPVSISNGPGYTITEQGDSSTLRINQLDVSRDNNAEYTCSVSVALGNETVQGSNSITLSVRGMLKNCFLKYLPA